MPDEVTELRRSNFIWLATLVSPLPLVLLWLVAVAFSIGLSEAFIAFVVVGYLSVLVPLFVSNGILRLISWSSLRAHLGVMFTVTFLPMLSVYHFMEFIPDSEFSFQVNDNSPRVVEFAVAGVLIAAIVALINVACMWIFWRVAVREKSTQCQTIGH